MIEVPDNDYICKMYEREQDRYNAASIAKEREEEIEHDELPFYDQEIE